jgi:CDP-diacylglycerol--serine O-phosphatidyltransferase
MEMNTYEPTRRLKLRRGVYLLPSFLTVGNLLCGYYAVLACYKGGAPELDQAAKAIGLAILFDSLDGRVARVTGTHSEFGKQLDSLADMISFGVAPAFLAYVWGLQTITQSVGFPQHTVQIGWLVTLAFVICCAWRLARFNIQGMLPASGMRYFVGMPCPAAAAMVAAVVHFQKSPLEDWRWSFAWLVLVGVLATLMASTLRFYSFKDFGWQMRQPSMVIVLMALLIGAIWLYSEVVLLLLASAYTLSGPALWLERAVRHRAPPRPPA